MDLTPAKAITDNNTTTSTINVATNAIITDVNIKSLTGTHTYVGDLTFTLTSPQNTSVVLLAQQCDGADNFSISFDDEAAAAFACPMNDGQTKRPANPLSIFNGQNAMGAWVLSVADGAGGDQGTLTGWTLEICVPAMQCTPPTFTSVVSVQPTCTPQSGSITVNANGGSTLEYSIDNGMNWQLSNVFNNLVPGSYPVVVRLQGDPGCLANYAQNPVVLAEPTNCDPCLTFNAADLPKPISETGPNTVSTINFTTSGTIQDVNVKNVTGNHTYVGDLTFTLTSPQNTSVVLLAQQCGSADNFNISFDDQAAAAFACPMNDGLTKQPANALSAFNGQTAQGNWTLQVNDGFNGDEGALTRMVPGDLCADCPMYSSGNQYGYCNYPDL